MRREAFDIKANDFLGVHYLALPQHIEVWDNHAMETVATFSGLAFKPDDSDFLDERRLQVVRLDLLGVDIFAIAEDDDFFLVQLRKRWPCESNIQGRL